MIKEQDILKLRLRAAMKFITKRTMYTSAGVKLSLETKDIIELLSIINPLEPFHVSENMTVEPKDEELEI